MGFYPKDHCTLLQWKSLNPYYAGFGSSTWCQFWGVSFKWAVTKTLVICRIILPSHMALGIQSPCQRMIGMSNHLLSKAFSFHYHSQKVIGSLGVFIISHYKNPYKNQSRGCRFVPYRFWETKARDGTGPRDLRYWFPGFGFDSGPNLQRCSSESSMRTWKRFASLVLALRAWFAWWWIRRQAGYVGWVFWHQWMKMVV